MLILQKTISRTVNVEQKPSAKDWPHRWDRHIDAKWMPESAAAAARRVRHHPNADHLTHLSCPTPSQTWRQAPTKDGDSFPSPGSNINFTSNWKMSANTSTVELYFSLFDIWLVKNWHSAEGWIYVGLGQKLLSVWRWGTTWAGQSLSQGFIWPLTWQCRLGAVMSETTLPWGTLFSL